MSVLFSLSGVRILRVSLALGLVASQAKPTDDRSTLPVAWDRNQDLPGSTLLFARDQLL